MSSSTAGNGRVLGSCSVVQVQLIAFLKAGAVHEVRHGLHASRHVAAVLVHVDVESTGAGSTSTLTVIQAVHLHLKSRPPRRVELNCVVTPLVHPQKFIN